jgi:hypothetical protein
MRFNKWTGLALGSFILFNAASATAQVFVPVRPPHAVVQRRGPSPGRGFVWTPGYQRWDGRRYVWTPGLWQRPPRPNARWVPYRWDRRGRGWEFRGGYWR